MNDRDNWNKHWVDLDVTARYNPAQTFRRELTTAWFKQQRVGDHCHLLDIGSGQGDLIAGLSRMFPAAEIAGIEISTTGIEQSLSKAPQAVFYQRDLLLTPGDDDPLFQWATLAVCSEVLEHVDEPDRILINGAKYLAPGALLYITVPGGPISAFDRHIGHRQHFTKASLTSLIRHAGLIPEIVGGVGFPFFNLYRIVVLLRGKALISDAVTKDANELSILAKMTMGAFSLVLRRKLNSISHGWQMIAQARKPN